MSRIAVVIDPWEYPYNGTVVSTRRFVATLERAGYRFQLLAIGGEGGPDDRNVETTFRRLSIPGANRIIDAMRAPLARPDRTKLRKLLDGCSLLHVQYPFFLAYAAIGEARKLGIPVVCSFHVQPENILRNLRLPSRVLSGLLYKLFVRCIYNQADQVLAPSSFAAELLCAHGLKVPVTVLSNGVPARFFAIRQIAGKGRRRLLSVGRLAREKQQETLIKAIALSKHAADIELVLAGVGPRERYLKRLAGALGVRAEIGWIEDDALLELYGGADLFVHAGTIELEGMSVLEAMGAGNAVVVSDSTDSACTALVSDEMAVFKRGDARNLAKRIDYWLSHPDRLAAQGRRNRELAATLTHEAAVTQLMRFYAEIISPTTEAFERQMTGTS